MPSSDGPSSSGGFDWSKSKTLRDFLACITPLDADQRRAIIAQTKALLSGYYVHLPFKIDEHHIDPLGDLDRLAAALPAPTDDVGFHTAMSKIFAKLRDLHTQVLSA